MAVYIQKFFCVFGAVEAFSEDPRQFAEISPNCVAYNSGKLLVLVITMRMRMRYEECGGSSLCKCIVQKLQRGSFVLVVRCSWWLKWGGQPFDRTALTKLLRHMHCMLHVAMHLSVFKLQAKLLSVLTVSMHGMAGKICIIPDGKSLDSTPTAFLHVRGLA